MQRQWEIKMSSEKKWYKLVFKQIQPIHIGMGSYGVINETRIFIPGWTMWGALTKAYNLKMGKICQKIRKNLKTYPVSGPALMRRVKMFYFRNIKMVNFILEIIRKKNLEQCLWIHLFLLQ